MWRSTRHARAVVPSDGEGPRGRPQSPMPGDPGDRGQCSQSSAVALAVVAPCPEIRRMAAKGAARPTQTDRTNGRTATEQRDDAIPRPPSSAVHGPVRPPIHAMPASWPRGLRVPFQQGARSPRPGFWLHLLSPVLQQALGTFEPGARRPSQVLTNRRAPFSPSSFHHRQ